MLNELKIAVVGLLLFYAGCAGTGQRPAAASKVRDVSSSYVHVGCGYLLAVHSSSTAFSFLFPHGQSVGDDELSVYIVDEALIVPIVVQAEEFGATGLTDEALLEQHMRSEAASFVSDGGWRGPVVVAGDEVASLLPTRLSTWWALEATEPQELMGEPVAEILYASVAIDNVVLSLMAPVGPNANRRAVTAAQARVLATVRESERPLDVRALAKDLKTPGAGWPGCADID